VQSGIEYGYVVKEDETIEFGVKYPDATVRKAVVMDMPAFHKLYIALKNVI